MKARLLYLVLSGSALLPNHRVAKSRGPISLLLPSCAVRRARHPFHQSSLRGSPLPSPTLSQPQVCTLHSATDHCELSSSLHSPHSLICSHQPPRRTLHRNPRPASRVASLPDPMEPSPAVAAELWCPPHLAAGGGRQVEATSALTEKSSGGRGGGSAVRRRPRETLASEEDSSRIVSTSGGGQDLVGPLLH